MTSVLVTRPVMVKHYYDLIKRAIDRIPSAEVEDIYALSFWHYGDEDDPEKPTLLVSFNTNANWQSSISGASDSEEAKWNFAFWLQNKFHWRYRKGWRLHNYHRLEKVS